MRVWLVLAVFLLTASAWAGPLSVINPDFDGGNDQSKNKSNNNNQNDQQNNNSDQSQSSSSNSQNNQANSSNNTNSWPGQSNFSQQSNNSSQQTPQSRAKQFKQKVRQFESSRNNQQNNGNSNNTSTPSFSDNDSLYESSSNTNSNQPSNRISKPSITPNNTKAKTSINPNNAKAKNSIKKGLSEIASLNYEQAIKDLQTFINNNANSSKVPQAYMYISISYRLNKQPQNSIQAAKKALSHSPSRNTRIARSSMLLIAGAAKQAGNYSMAAKWYNQLIHNYPDTPQGNMAQNQLNRMNKQAQ